MVCKNGFIAFLLVFAVNDISAQYNFTKQWDKRFGGTSDEGFYSLMQTQDNGYLLCGYSNSGISGDKSQGSQGNSDYWIIKIDSIGNKEWDKRFGGSGVDVLFSAEQTTDGGYILGGNSYSSISGDKTESSRGNSDYWVVKIDSIGTKQWDKRFGGTNNDVLATVIQATDGKYLIGGASNSGTTGDKTQNNWDNTFLTDDYWIVKIDESGSKEWDKRFGGTGEDGFYCMTKTADKGYLLGGTSSSDSSGDKTQPTRGTIDYWVVKIDSAGNKQWDKRYGVHSGAQLSFMIQSQDKGYVLSGVAAGGINGDKTENGCGIDCWVVKIDSMGNKLWDRSYGGASDEYVFQVEQTFDKGYLITATSSSNNSCSKTEDNSRPTELWELKIDSNGNKQWDKTIFSNLSLNYTNGIQSKDGCYIICASVCCGALGYQSYSTWNNSADYWILKFCMDTLTGIGDEGRGTGDEGVVQVYPNPFSGDLNLSLTLPEGEGTAAREAKFTITDAMGRKIYEREENNLATNYTKVLDLSWLARGVYFVSISCKDETVTKKVVKE